MAKGDFTTVVKQKNNNIDKFINNAKVDGDDSFESSNERRGKYMIDKNTGKKVLLGGKVLEVPLNASEFELLKKAAKNSGLPVATYVRSNALLSAKKLLNID
ncbi:hypothetical protein [Arsenophonus sp. PmNCSU2021_1]|uniref:hypothetical protein n=1 Tax=Arsenophonus sp. PmNCSU2021_1 TaxID=3118989 RepID=UPI002FEECEB1